MSKQRGRTRPRTVTDQPSLLARIERAIYRLQNTHGLPLQTLDDGSDPEVVLRECADDHVHMRRVLCELREAVLEQVGKDQTDRLRHESNDQRARNVGAQSGRVGPQRSLREFQLPRKRFVARIADEPAHQSSPTRRWRP